MTRIRRPASPLTPATAQARTDAIATITRLVELHDVDQVLTLGHALQSAAAENA